MIIIKLLVVLLSTTSFSSEVYISEIYANPPGQHGSKTWFEITNLRDRQVNISHFSLEIYGDKTTKPLINTNQSFKTPLVLDDFMLVAEADDLGLGLCLNSSIPVILVPELSLAAVRKICFAINNQAASCVLLNKKDHFSDGVALFRPLSSGQPSNFWLNEPCLLTDAIFATPGMSERACIADQSFASHIFDECQTQGPRILNGGDFTDLWRETRCVAHHESAQLCYELSEPGKIPAQWGRLIRLKSRDLSGYFQEQSMRLEAHKLSFPLIRVERIGNTRLALNFDLIEHKLLNYRVKNRDMLLAAGAFIETGPKVIELDISEALASVNIEFYGIDGLFERQELSLKPQLPSQQSCHSSGPPLMPWLLLYALRLLRARAGFKY